MPIISGGGRFNGGTITTPLTVADATAGYLDPIFRVTGEHTTLDVDNDGTFLFASDDAAVVVAKGTGNTSGQVVAANAADGSSAKLRSGPVSGSQPYVVVTEVAQGSVYLMCTVPADSFLAAGGMALWFDPTNGAAKLMVKAKTANGVVATASIPLT